MNNENLYAKDAFGRRVDKNDIVAYASVGYTISLGRLAGGFKRRNGSGEPYAYICPLGRKMYEEEDSMVVGFPFPSHWVYKNGTRAFARFPFKGVVVNTGEIVGHDILGRDIHIGDTVLTSNIYRTKDRGYPYPILRNNIGMFKGCVVEASHGRFYIQSNDGGYISKHPDTDSVLRHDINEAELAYYMLQV